jgi:transposase InsO family protein
MMIKATSGSTGALWARFRFSVVGSLLSSPPARGALQTAIRSLALKTWSHPVTGRDLRVAASTITSWYYTARRKPDDPVGALRRAVRKDRGKIALAPALIERLHFQYSDHPGWSYQLHYDNLAALVQADSRLGRLPSYSTIKRYMRANGLVKKPRLPLHTRPGEARAEARRQTREVRSYEAEYVGALWHLDFHHGSKKVLTSGGRWQRPIALGILDDHSRLCCHVQWYLSETAEDLVHGLSQAIQKRGLPRSILTDNGPAMVAEEVTEGLLRLGIAHERTLPYSPYQNGKQEAFWGTLEGRLMKMLEAVAELTLELLNQTTQAWAEMDYNRAVHRETGCSPVERFGRSADVLRDSPQSESLRDAFRLETTRSQRQSDGTVSMEGVRFEIPSRYRHFREVTVRYARWDLGRVDLVDDHSGVILAPIYPLDKTANADGRRAAIESVGIDMPQKGQPRRAGGELPPLLKRILEEYSATGMPPAYLPKSSPEDNGELS